jgi:thymidylate synthase (FAD)
MRIVEPGFVIENDLDGTEILRRIERAGRTAYKSESRITAESAPKFVASIIARGHESVLEHEKITVRIICDRGVSHELVRHRIASYTQESTRFCDYAKAGEIQVVEPPGLTQNQRDYWESAMLAAERSYQGMRTWGAPPQIARSVLSTCLKTEIVITANLREWRHILRLRTAPAAHPQMRQIMLPLLAELQRLVPVVFDAISERASA